MTGPTTRPTPRVPLRHQPASGAEAQLVSRAAIAWVGLAGLTALLLLASVLLLLI